MLDESMALDWLFEWQRSRDLAEARARSGAGRADPALQARVQLALGRSLHRFNRDREAAVVLRQAAALAEAAGDQGYEVLVAADLLLGFLLPFIGHARRGRGAPGAGRAAVPSQGRRAAPGGHVEQPVVPVGGARRPAALHGGQESVLAYARRMGNVNLERNASQNRAYYLYWRGEYDEALPPARRWIEIDERYFRQGGFRPEGAVLLARILWCAGDRGRGAAAGGGGARPSGGRPGRGQARAPAAAQRSSCCST